MRKDDELKLEVAPEVMGEGVQVGHASDSASDSSDSYTTGVDSENNSVQLAPSAGEDQDTPETPVGDSEGLDPSNGVESVSDVESAENGTQGRTEGVEGEEDATDADPQTFPKPYVDKLRKEAADNRAKAKRTDDLAARLHTALVQATGKLADPSDLPFDEAHLDDPEALDAAIEALIASKPHLASRTPRGNIGQGVSGKSEEDFSLAGWLGGMAR